jgi:hypothetical protein
MIDNLHESIQQERMERQFKESEYERKKYELESKNASSRRLRILEERNTYNTSYNKGMFDDI